MPPVTQIIAASFAQEKITMTGFTRTILKSRKPTGLRPIRRTKGARHMSMILAASARLDMVGLAGYSGASTIPWCRWMASPLFPGSSVKDLLWGVLSGIRSIPNRQRWINRRPSCPTALLPLPRGSLSILGHPGRLNGYSGDE